jgi:hypothetical protein
VETEAIGSAFALSWSVPSAVIGCVLQGCENYFQKLITRDS